MKTKNYYLIDSPKIKELNKEQKEFLEKQLTIYHTHSSTIIDKAKAIQALAVNERLEDLRFEYNAWLYDFVNDQLKTVKTEEAIETLEFIKAYCYHTFGLKSYLTGNFTDALEIFFKSFKIREKLNELQGLFQTCYHIALIYHSIGDFMNAIKFYEKSVELSINFKDKTKVALLYNNLALIFAEKGNQTKASNYQYKALSIFEEDNGERGIALCYMNIADSLVEQLELDEALKYFFSALNLYKKIGDKASEALSYSGIGSVYQAKGEHNTALKYYMKTENLPQSNQSPNYAYLKMGTLYESQNQISLAIEFYNKSLELSETTESKRLLSETLSKIGALEIKKGNIEEAHIQIERAFELAQALRHPELIMEASSARTLLAVAKNDYKLAYEMEKLKNEMKEKILNKENTKEVIKHQLKYEYERQLKQKDIEVEQEKLNNQYLQEKIDLFLAKNKQLTLKNKLINEQLAEKDKLKRKLTGKNNGVFNSI